MQEEDAYKMWFLDVLKLACWWSDGCFDSAAGAFVSISSAEVYFW
jgi:hypothetical protein